MRGRLALCPGLWCCQSSTQPSVLGCAPSCARPAEEVGARVTDGKRELAPQSNCFFLEQWRKQTSFHENNRTEGDLEAAVQAPRLTNENTELRGACDSLRAPQPAGRTARPADPALPIPRGPRLLRLPTVPQNVPRS